MSIKIGQWSLFQEKGPEVISISGEREAEEKVKSMVEILAVDGHILVPKLYGVLRQKELEEEIYLKSELPQLLLADWASQREW